jgi:hypothetical protein
MGTYHRYYGLDPTVVSPGAISIKGCQKGAVAQHIAVVGTFRTDFRDTDNRGIPSGLALSRNS